MAAGATVLAQAERAHDAGLQRGRVPVVCGGQYALKAATAVGAWPVPVAPALALTRPMPTCSQGGSPSTLKPLTLRVTSQAASRWAVGLPASAEACQALNW